MNWADHFNTYEDACRFYGADTPADCEREARYLAAEEAVEEQDAMEARGGPRVRALWEVTDSDLPF